MVSGQNSLLFQSTRVAELRLHAVGRTRRVCRANSGRGTDLSDPQTSNFRFHFPGREVGRGTRVPLRRATPANLQCRELGTGWAAVFRDRRCEQRRYREPGKFVEKSGCIVTRSGSFGLRLFSSPVQACDPERVGRPGRFAKAGFAHPLEHFVRRRKTFHRGGQVGIWPANARDPSADCRQQAFEVDAIELADYATGFTEIKDSALPARTKNSRNLAQTGIIVSQIAETEGRGQQIEFRISKWQSQGISLNPHGSSLARLCVRTLQHRMRKIRAKDMCSRILGFLL